MKNDYEHILKTIAGNIKHFRKEKGLSQYDLAIKSDLDKNYLGYVENRKYNVTMKTLCKIANALDIDVMELMQKEIA